MSATSEQPPAAPDEPVAAAPAPDPTAGSGLTDQHPEILVGGALVGGALLATILKRLGRH